MEKKTNSIGEWIEITGVIYNRLIKALTMANLFCTVTSYSDPTGSNPLSNGIPTSVSEIGIRKNGAPLLKRKDTKECGAWKTRYWIWG